MRGVFLEGRAYLRRENWRGDLTWRYWFFFGGGGGGLILGGAIKQKVLGVTGFGGAYTWRGLFSEFYGSLKNITKF